MAKRLTEKQKKIIINSFRDGTTVNDLSKEFKCTTSTIIRNLKKELGEKTYKELANKFILEGKTICSIGTKKESLVVPGSADMRECDMGTLFGVLNSCSGVFGPSSGPMHLASLCGAPHVVWSESKNHKRYTSTWNPLNTPVLFLDEFGWHPKPEYIYSKYSNWIKEK